MISISYEYMGMLTSPALVWARREGQLTNRTLQVKRLNDKSLTFQRHFYGNTVARKLSYNLWSRVRLSSFRS